MSNGAGMDGLDWLLEIFLLVMLAATMFHAVRLERALGTLRRDRAALEELVAGFNESTRQAENGVEKLRAAADSAGRQVARHVDQARILKGDLEFLTARGEKLCDQLEAAVRAPRSIDMPVSDPVGQIFKPVPTLNLESRLSSGDAEARPRSQAEKDLLRALKAVR